MKTTKQKHLIMICVSSVILIFVNLGILMAANCGAISPINNMALWGTFAVLNMASIIWAISLLGLQPFVIALAYVAGGYIAYQGVRGINEISVAEVATAGATYGAFGALAVGNATAKVRLAFFRKGQVPFVFIIVGLLVIDAALNSGISNAGASVIINAVIFPFVLAGVIIGLIGSVFNRFGIGRTPEEVLEVVEKETVMKKADLTRVVGAEKRETQMPEDAVKVDDPIEVADSMPSVTIEIDDSTHLEEQKVEEEFFPLEIDTIDEYVLSESNFQDVELEITEEFEEPSFNENYYVSESLAESDESNVMVKEPVVEVVLDLEEEIEGLNDTEPTQEIEEGEANAASSEETKSGQSSEAWLSNHLNLLNKLNIKTEDETKE